MADNTQNKRTLIILPAYNEEGKIGRVVTKIRATGVPCDIVVVDDCSTDNTRQEALDAGAEVITHRTNSGVGAGIRTGMKFGLDRGYTLGVVMSGDDQHEPSELPRALEPITSGEFDFIQGSRYMPGGQVINERTFRLITTKWYSRFFSLLSGAHITDATNGFRSFKFDVLRDPTINLDQEWLSGYELEPYFLYKVVTGKRWRFKEVPITVRYHAVGRDYTKMRPIRDWWR
ncbi:MAG TPA: glycosyltransferase family 2 protein, partial [candidate division Zixibacteria bacterium]|nr:glycosyltransferase family 2 protein [candidate division Zixibacteria bacterium]